LSRVLAGVARRDDPATAAVSRAMRRRGSCEWRRPTSISPERVGERSPRSRAPAWPVPWRRSVHRSRARRPLRRRSLSWPWAGCGHEMGTPDADVIFVPNPTAQMSWATDDALAWPARCGADGPPSPASADSRHRPAAGRPAGCWSDAGAYAAYEQWGEVWGVSTPAGVAAVRPGRPAGPSSDRRPIRWPEALTEAYGRSGGSRPESSRRPGPIRRPPARPGRAGRRDGRCSSCSCGTPLRRRPADLGHRTPWRRAPASR
jgi:hypothetical protein